MGRSSIVLQRFSMRSRCAWEIGSGTNIGSPAGRTVTPHAKSPVPTPKRTTRKSSSDGRRSHRRCGWRITSDNAPGAGLRNADCSRCSSARSRMVSSCSSRCSRKRSRESSACLRGPVLARSNAPPAVMSTTTSMATPTAMRMGFPEENIMRTMPMPATTGSTAFNAPPPPPPPARMVGTDASSTGFSGVICRCKRAGR